jgi:hypothetical protein
MRNAFAFKADIIPYAQRLRIQSRYHIICATQRWKRNNMRNAFAISYHMRNAFAYKADIIPYAQRLRIQSRYHIICATQRFRIQSRRHHTICATHSHTKPISYHMRNAFAYKADIISYAQRIRTHQQSSALRNYNNRTRASHSQRRPNTDAHSRSTLYATCPQHAAAAIELPLTSSSR